MVYLLLLPSPLLPYQQPQQHLHPSQHPPLLLLLAVVVREGVAGVVPVVELAACYP